MNRFNAEEGFRGCESSSDMFLWARTGVAQRGRRRTSSNRFIAKKITFVRFYIMKKIELRYRDTLCAAPAANLLFPDQERLSLNKHA
jgi:hypothetical protein